MFFVFGISVVIVVWFGGREVIQATISRGDLVGFNVYLGMLTWPMIAFGWVINLLERGRASMARLNYILETKPDIADVSAVTNGFAVQGEVEFRNLNFAYNGTPVLRNISLRIGKGRTVAIV